MFNKIKNNFFKEVKRAVIQNPYGELPVGSSGITFVILVGSGFNQNITNASTTCRMGWAHGFEEIGIPYVFLSVSEMERLDELPNPIIWTTGYEIEELTKTQKEILRKYKKAVAVNPWFKGEKEFYQKNDYPAANWSDKLRKEIIKINPDFIFTIAPESSFQFFKGWIDVGMKLVSLPMACDTKIYPKKPKKINQFDSVKMAFVGGYWEYKARSFDRYLKPFQEHLHIYGYSPWPYANYKGQIGIYEETSLYHQASLCPVINEPHVSTMGIDVNERVFKVLGSGGLAITDVTPAYREHFSNNELLVPRSIEEYYEMVRSIIKDGENISMQYRNAGQTAVLERHTYVIRANTFLLQLGINFNSKTTH